MSSLDLRTLEYMKAYQLCLQELVKSGEISDLEALRMSLDSIHTGFTSMAHLRNL